MKLFESKKVQETLEGLDEIISYLDTMQGGDLDTTTVLNIALKIQENALRTEYNQMYAAANVLNAGELVPSALEKIAMELEKLNNK
jgi:hypothetical protein